MNAYSKLMMIEQELANLDARCKSEGVQAQDKWLKLARTYDRLREDYQAAIDALAIASPRSRRATDKNA